MSRAAVRASATYTPDADAPPAATILAVLRTAAAGGHLAAFCWPSGATDLATPWGLVEGVRREEGGRRTTLDTHDPHDTPTRQEAA